MWNTRRTQGAADARAGPWGALFDCALASALNKPPSMIDRLAGILCSFEALAAHLGSWAGVVKSMNCMLHMTAIKCDHAGPI
jgi:hypothetical protein